MAGRPRKARKPQLRAVPDTPPVEVAEPEAPAAPSSVLEAAERGSRKDVLTTMRKRLAKALDSDKTSPRDLASISRRLLEIDAQVRVIEEGEKEALDESGDATEDEEWEAV
ncbi:hypothetical protein [Actinomyces procaprae]|uniref:hypothetical protein n=1 Tax=Actinomyces procaprae TaxID=2560010 RepID=UPI0010A229EC|nr:hypothetical protein [Actinomyces procaprae]